jgi:hypothetical protein
VNGLAYGGLAVSFTLAGVILFLGGGAVALYSRSAHHPSNARLHLGLTMIIAGLLVEQLALIIRVGDSMALLHVSLFRLLNLIGFGVALGAQAMRWVEARRAAHLGGDA